MSNILSLFVMAKNESRCIKRCLDSVSPFVDQVVVLDTGSTDGTVDIARGCGARIEFSEWENDFARTRNYGMEKIETPWVLMLDADEWMISGGTALNNFRKNPPKLDKVFECAMHMRPYEQTNALAINVIGTFFAARCFPSNLRFLGRVHERIVHKLPTERLDILLGHDGYEAEQAKKKVNRNYPLLKKTLEERPDDAIIHYYLAKELQSTEVNGGLSGEVIDEIDTLYRRALALTSENCPSRELIVREFLLFLRSRQQIDAGIRLVFVELERNLLSRELCYVTAIFLYEAVLSRVNIDAKLLIGAADGMFIRLKNTVDKHSAYFPYEIDLKLLAALRSKALDKLMGVYDER